MLSKLFLGSVDMRQMEPILMCLRQYFGQAQDLPLHLLIHVLPSKDEVQQ